MCWQERGKARASVPSARHLSNIGVSTVIGGKNAVSHRFSVFPPKVQALSVSADGNACHVCRIGAGAFQHLTDDSAVCRPHLLHIPLGEAWGGREDGGAAARGAKHSSVSVIEDGLCDSSAVVDTEVCFHSAVFFP
jgi:hypothetical protein